MTAKPPSAPTRRVVLVGAAALCLPNLAPRTASATPDSMAAAMRAVTGEVTVTPGRVKLELPPLVENGNTVPLSIKVDSAMTADDYVSDIYVVGDANPNPGIVRFHLTPTSGRAEVATRIRLGGTGNVTINDSSTLSGNTASFGGAIDNSASVTVNDSTLSGNTASSGGGIDNGGTVVVSNGSILTKNSAAQGGGIISGAGKVTVNLGNVLQGFSRARNTIVFIDDLARFLLPGSPAYAREALDLLRLALAIGHVQVVSTASA